MTTTCRLVLAVLLSALCLNAIAGDPPNWSEQKIGNLYSGGSPFWDSATAAGRALVDSQVQNAASTNNRNYSPATALACTDAGDATGHCEQYFSWINDCCGPPVTVTDPFGANIYAWCPPDLTGNNVYAVRVGNLDYTCPGPIYLDRYHGGKPPPQCPVVGNPIYPLLGSKRQEEAIPEVSLNGIQLRLIYDTRRKVPSDNPTLMFNIAPSPSFGELWSGSFHRNLVFKGGGKTAQASRAGGSWITFTQQADGSYRPDVDVNDRLAPYGDGWIYVDSVASSQESYDSQGNLLSIKYATGGSLLFSYSDANTPVDIAPSPGLIIQIKDQNGRSLQFQYARSGSITHIVKLVDASGRLIAVTYDVNGNLSRLQWSDGGIRQFLYERSDIPWALTGITDENGSRLGTYGYDSQGRAVSTQRGGGVDAYSVSYATPPSWQIVQTLDPAGQIVWRDHYWRPAQGTTVSTPMGSSLSLDETIIQGVPRLTGVAQPGGAGCAASSMAYSYDGSGNLTNVVDFNGHATSYPSYDTNRNLELQRVEASGTPQARTISTQWHPTWRFRSRLAGPKKLSTWVYNGQPDPTNGNLVTSCAPAAAVMPDGSPLAVLCKKVEQTTTDVDGHVGFSAMTTGTARIWQWTYNADGQMLTSRAPRADANNTTTYAYRVADDASTPMLYRRGDLYTITDAVGHVTTMPEYDLSGRVTKVVDANGTATVLAYGSRGWLTGSVVTGGGSSEVTNFEYDGAGQLKRATKPDGSYLAYSYDAAHRLTDVADGLGNTIHYTLDAMGNRIQEQTKDPSGTLAGNITRAYDALNRLRTITGALQ